MPWAVKLIMPIKKYLKANYYQRKILRMFGPTKDRDDTVHEKSKQMMS